MVKQVKLEKKGLPVESSLRESVLCYTIMSATYSSCSVFSEKNPSVGKYSGKLDTVRKGEGDERYLGRGQKGETSDTAGQTIGTNEKKIC